MAAEEDNQPELPITSRQLVVSQLVQSRGRDLVSVPYIRLSGLWLKRAGFSIGTRIEVLIQPGKLLIVCSEPEQNARAANLPHTDFG
jgi:hypothetical protein